MKDELVTIEEMLDYGEWARVNGERHRGNLQKNGIELYNQFKKEQDERKRIINNYAVNIVNCVHDLHGR